MGTGIISRSAIDEAVATMAACKLIDCTAFEDRLKPFGGVLKSVIAAQEQVDAADAKVGKAQAAVAELDLDLNELLEGLARRLLLATPSTETPAAATAS